MMFFMIFVVFFSTMKHLVWSAAVWAPWRSPTGSCRMRGGMVWTRKSASRFRFNFWLKFYIFLIKCFVRLLSITACWFLTTRPGPGGDLWLVRKCGTLNSGFSGGLLTGWCRKGGVVLPRNSASGSSSNSWGSWREDPGFSALKLTQGEKVQVCLILADFS